MMSIDVIIPVYRPTEKLKKLLKAIQKQTYRAEHIYLLHTEDGKSLGWAKEVCQEVPVMEIAVKKQAFDHGGTRDMGMRVSGADIVVLMTQDAVPANARVFEALVKALAGDEKVAVAYARQIAGTRAHIIERYTRRFNYPEKSHVKSKADLEELGIKTYFCSNVCAAYKKSIYMESGGFEYPIIFNEDMVYAAKAIGAGYKIAYEAKAVVWHTHNYSGKQLLKRNFDLGVSQADYPEIFASIRSENEGIQLVKQMTCYFLKRKSILLILELWFQSGCKYLGYQLGKHYKSLSEILVKWLTMNPEYWQRRRDNGRKEET